MLNDMELWAKLSRIGNLMVNQEKARTIVPAAAPEQGFWFGGGNMIERDGKLYVCGRYRNGGDSRTGVKMGTRGCELAVFCSEDKGENWTKVLSFGKDDLLVGGLSVLSIEGTALHNTKEGVELYISTEKQGRQYSDGLDGFLKKGTGIWSIDRIAANSVERLASAPIEEILRSDDPGTANVKDPFVYDTKNGDTVLLFCHHPFCWSSSNTGYMIRPAGSADFGKPVFEHFPRGTTWDVAITRGTALIDLPNPMGRDLTLVYYDGGESLRNLDEHEGAVKRPRGYSCEEIGGLAYLEDGNLGNIQRVSKNLPLFLSPWGQKTSRYVDVLAADGGYYVTWQQSRKDSSQPLVMNFVTAGEIEKVWSENEQ